MNQPEHGPATDDMVKRDVPMMQPSTVPAKIKDGNERVAKFTLEDGSVLSVYVHLDNVRRRLGELGPDGQPIYDFDMKFRSTHKPKG